MGFTINKAVVSGNLCQDPALRQTRGGTEVLSLRVAVNDRVKSSQTGEWEDRPSFLDVTVFGGMASALSRSLAKGSGVAVAGKLRQRSWEDESGTRRYRVEIVAEDVVPLGRRDRAQAPQPAQPPVAAAPAPAAERPMSAEEAAAYTGARMLPADAPQPPLCDEDIPF